MAQAQTSSTIATLERLLDYLNGVAEEAPTENPPAFWVATNAIVLELAHIQGKGISQIAAEAKERRAT